MTHAATTAPTMCRGRAAEAAGHPWIGRRWFTPSGALVAEAAAGLDPAAVFAAWSRRPHVLWLDSAQVDADAPPEGPRLGRHSFVAADPIRSFRVDAPAGPAGLAAALADLRTLLGEMACATIPGLPPFQGGVAGLVSYECGLAWLGIAPVVPPPVPLVSLHAYDVVFAYDHDAARGWFIAQGVPGRGPVERRRRAETRLDELLQGDNAAATPAAPPPPRPRLPHPLPGHAAVHSTRTAASYAEMVAAGIEFVRAGDVFQVNLAQHFDLAADVDPVVLHARARALNPAPFAAFFDAGPARIVSMSPERCLQVSGRVARMHPIKGTRRVIASPEADLYAGAELEASAKDRAENVMIVDLVRNDLARVCTPASVRVEALCRLERYRYVQHLVSIVAGRLRPGLGPLDALAVALPAGSVTGAPKHRACEIIAELEDCPRGAYCGSLGYVGFDGGADFNLLIRTFVVAPGSVTFAAGGGITAASDPAAEHAESLHKAEGMLRVLDSLGLAAGHGAGRAAPEARP